MSLLLGESVVWASQPEDLGISVRDKVQQGKEKPAILLQPRVNVKKLVVRLKGTDGGKTQVLEAGRLRKGSKKALSFKQSAGRQEYEAMFEVTWASGKTAEFGFTFAAMVVGPLEVRVSEKHVDLDARKLKFTSTREVRGAELQVFGEGGRVLGNGRVDLGRGAAGALHEISWTQADASVRRLELKVYDPEGFWKGVEVRPFFVEPREDQIFFKTGSHAVESSESGKLGETLTWIRKGISAAKNQAGVALGMRLYVGGYTDTVGSSESNRSLSMNRAESIASYFRRQGLKIDIYYQGFGEDALAVSTPDNTDNKKNRRTVYVLSSQVPPRSKIFPRTQWRKLP